MNKVGKIQYLEGRIGKLETLLIREMAKKRNLEDENKRLKDGSLAEYYQNQFYKLKNEHVTLQNELIMLKLKNK